MDKGKSMSDATNRRYKDARMDKLELSVEKMGNDIVDIKTKINNGFSHSIASTEEKVNYIDERNREEHHALIESLQKLSDKVDAKFDRMMWVWISGSASIAIAVIVYIVKGILG